MPCCQGTKNMRRDIFNELLGVSNEISDSKWHELYEYQEEAATTELDMETGEVVIITTLWPGQTSTSSAGNTSSYSPQLWARCPTCSSSRQICPQLWCLGLGMTKAEWLPKDSWEDSMRIWRKTNAERQALRGCCGGLVDRKVHSKKVHSQRVETFKMEWRPYANTKKIVSQFSKAARTC